MDKEDKLDLHSSKYRVHFVKNQKKTKSLMGRSNQASKAQLTLKVRHKDYYVGTASPKIQKSYHLIHIGHAALTILLHGNDKDILNSHYKSKHYTYKRLSI